MISCAGEEIRLERLADPFDGTAPFGEAHNVLRHARSVAHLRTPPFMSTFALPDLLTPAGFVEDVVGGIRHQRLVGNMCGFGTAGGGLDASRGVHPLQIDGLREPVPPP